MDVLAVPSRGNIRSPPVMPKALRASAITLATSKIAFPQLPVLRPVVAIKSVVVVGHGGCVVVERDVEALRAVQVANEPHRSAPHAAVLFVQLQHRVVKILFREILHVADNFVKAICGKHDSVLCRGGVVNSRSGVVLLFGGTAFLFCCARVGGRHDGAHDVASVESYRPARLGWTWAQGGMAVVRKNLLGHTTAAHVGRAVRNETGTASKDRSSCYVAKMSARR